MELGKVGQVKYHESLFKKRNREKKERGKEKCSRRHLLKTQSEHVMRVRDPLEK